MTVFLHLLLTDTWKSDVARITDCAHWCGEQGISARFIYPSDDEDNRSEASETIYERDLGSYIEEEWLDVAFEDKTSATLFKLRFSDWLFNLEPAIEAAREAKLNFVKSLDLSDLIPDRSIARTNTPYMLQQVAAVAKTKTSP